MLKMAKKVNVHGLTSDQLLDAAEIFLQANNEQLVAMSNRIDNLLERIRLK